MRNERNDKQYNDRNENKHIKYFQSKIISLAVGHNKLLKSLKRNWVFDFPRRPRFWPDNSQSRTDPVYTVAIFRNSNGLARIFNTWSRNNRKYSDVFHTKSNIWALTWIYIPVFLFSGWRFYIWNSVTRVDFVVHTCQMKLPVFSTSKAYMLGQKLEFTLEYSLDTLDTLDALGAICHGVVIPRTK